MRGAGPASAWHRDLRATDCHRSWQCRHFQRRRHLFEADSGGFHQKTSVAARQPQGHVPCDILALVLAHQDAACIDKFFAQSVGHDLEAR
jgi:hypothetical protein